MRKTRFLALAAATAALAAGSARGADINRRIIAELDPSSPVSASYEESTNGVATSKWGGQVDFNVGGVISTGPEFWTGTFAVHGPSDPTTTYRREDFWPGEDQKLDAIRLRWNVALWENPSSMRGWFLRGGYAYTRVNSRAHRYTEEGGVGDALPANILGSPDDETDLVTDIRHGVMAGFGNRWLMLENKLSISLGASITTNFKRSVSVDSKDPNALADYEDMIADLPDTRMSVRPLPEANLGVGWAW